jgi:hypothetical protein
MEAQNVHHYPHRSTLLRIYTPTRKVSSCVNRYCHMEMTFFRKSLYFSEISGSHGGEYEDDPPLECCAMQSRRN